MWNSQSNEFIVFILQLHMDENGVVIDSDEHRTFFDYQHIEPRLIPAISAPFRPSKRPLKRLWRALKNVPSITVLQLFSHLTLWLWICISSHWLSWKVELLWWCCMGSQMLAKPPLPMLPWACLGLKLAALGGCGENFFINLASQTSLGLIYDDPNKVQKVENITVDF